MDFDKDSIVVILAVSVVQKLGTQIKLWLALGIGNICQLLK